MISLKAWFKQNLVSLSFQSLLVPNGNHGANGRPSKDAYGHVADNASPRQAFTKALYHKK